MQLRLATRQDEPGIQHVIQTVFEEYGWPWEAEDYHSDLYDIEAAYFASGGAFWVMEDEGRVVGTSALDVFDPIPGEGDTVEIDGVPKVTGADCSLERLYVLPEYRGRRVGFALWNQVIEEAKARGYRRMEVWSDKVLTAAHALYERSGAERVGERLCPSPDQSPEWGFRLDL
jgi:putative acetyltransferase